jgi:hypothetical protein
MPLSPSAVIDGRDPTPWHGLLDGAVHNDFREVRSPIRGTSFVTSSPVPKYGIQPCVSHNRLNATEYAS